MQHGPLIRRASFVVAAFLATATISSCSHPAMYHDSVYNQDHRWDRREEAAYRRWEAEQHLADVEFSRRQAEEQRAYWAWRHDHPE